MRRSLRSGTAQCWESSEILLGAWTRSDLCLSLARHARSTAESWGLGRWHNTSDPFFCPELRNLGWRIVHDVLPVNVKLFRQHTSVTDRCPLCVRGRETLEHLFLACPVVLPVLQVVESLCSDVLGAGVVFLTPTEVL